MAESAEGGDGFVGSVSKFIGSLASSKKQKSGDEKEGKSVGFAKDIGEKIQQSMTVATSTGDKFFGAGGGNPNLVQNSSLAWVAVAAVALLVALYLYLRLR